MALQPSRNFVARVLLSAVPCILMSVSALPSTVDHLQQIPFEGDLITPPSLLGGMLGGPDHCSAHGRGGPFGGGRSLFCYFSASCRYLIFVEVASRLGIFSQFPPFFVAFGSLTSTRLLVLVWTAEVLLAQSRHLSGSLKSNRVPSFCPLFCSCDPSLSVHFQTKATPISSEPTVSLRFCGGASKSNFASSVRPLISSFGAFFPTTSKLMQHPFLLNHSDHRSNFRTELVVLNCVPAILSLRLECLPTVSPETSRHVCT